MKREIREITSRGDWLDWRRGHITASRVAALFDAHPYLSRDQLAAELAGQSRGDSPAMRAGRILEAAFPAALAEERPDWQVAKAATYHCLPDLRLGATPDFWVGDDGLVQAKTVAPVEWEKWQGRPPLGYTLQTLTELLVTDRKWGVLAVMVRSPSFPLYLFDVPRHAGAEAKILEAVAAWWRAHDAGEIALPMPHEELAAMVDDGSHKDLSGDNLLPGLLEERETLKAAERRLKDIDAEIVGKIGVARSAWLPGWTLKYPTIQRKEYTVKAGSYRRLDVKRSEGAET